MNYISTLKTIVTTCTKTFALACILSSNAAMAQVHVVGPEEIKIGKDQAVNAQPGQVEVVDILGSVYMTQEPTNGSFAGGSYFTTKWCTNGFPDPLFPNLQTNNPVMLPQWSNYFIGDGSNPMEQVYSNEFYATVGVWTLSDKNHKTNIRPMQSALDKLMKVNSYRYDLIYNEKEGESKDIVERLKNTGLNQAGFMAQEIRSDYPHLVRSFNGKETVGVNYTGFIPEIVRAMQEQQEIIDALKAEIETLKGSEIKLQNSNTDQNTSELFDINPIAPKKPVVVNYQTESQGDYQIRVYNLAGKQVYKTETLNPDINSIELPRKKLGAGSYHVTLFKNGEEVNTKKVIVLD
jgi:hypothetical protein